VIELKENIVWEKTTQRCVVQIISSSNWKAGIPLNPQIPKWLVKITDRFTQDTYVPTDDELILITHTLDSESLTLVAEAFSVKEKHNRANLKNPESRKKEAIFNQIIQSIHRIVSVFDWKGFL